MRHATPRHILFLLLFLIISCSFAHADIVTGLVGHWKFDETSGTSARDASGRGNTGSLKPTGNEPTWVSGKFNGALYFDGINHTYVDCGNGTSLSFGINNFSAALWFRMQAGAAEGALISNGALGSVKGWGIEYISGHITAEVYATARARTGYLLSLDDTWHHVTMVVDRSGYFKIYSDGIYKSQLDISSQAGASTNKYNINIGRVSGASYYPLTGFIDDVRIYNRALTQDDVTALYNNGGPSRVRNAVIRGGVIH